VRSILTCEKTFFTGLNTAAANSGSVNQIGLAAFGADAVTADMTPPVSPDDPLGDPGDGNTVINSIVLINNDFNYRVGQYTQKDGDADGTNYTAALQQAASILAASSDPSKFVVFASDGLSNQGGGGFAAAVAAVQGTGAVVNSIAIGASAACTGGTHRVMTVTVTTQRTFTTLVNYIGILSSIPLIRSATLRVTE
jgi:hypothetical protein